MWCSACQQDVPGVPASGQDLTICCMRCGASLGRHAAESPVRLPPPTAETSGPSDLETGVESDDQTLPELLELGDWEMDELAANAKRLAKAVQAYRPSESIAQPVFRIDSAHDAPGESRSTRSHAGVSHLSKALANRRHSETSLPVVLFSLALAVFVCGSLLVVRSLWEQRPSLSGIGWPLVLGSQIGLLAVVIWQLEMIWLRNRTAFQMIRTLRRQIVEMQQVGSGGQVPSIQPAQELSGSSGGVPQPHVASILTGQPRASSPDIGTTE